MSLQGYAGYITHLPLFGEPKRSDGPAIALLWCTPMSWDARTDLDPESTAQARGGASTQVTETSRAIVAAVAWEPAPCWQIGVGLHATYDYASFTQHAWAQDASGFTESTSTLDSWTWSLRASAGACWKPVDGAAFGLSLTSAALPFLRSGTRSYDRTVVDLTGGSMEVTAGSTDDPRLASPHPWQVAAGAGMDAGAWRFDAAVCWILAGGTHDTLPGLAVRTSTTSGGTTTIDDGSIPAASTRYGDVVNLRAAATRELPGIGRLHLGGFTDRTWVDSSDVYDAIDLYGITGGITLVWERVELTFGAQYAFSSAAPLRTVDPKTGETGDGEVRLRIISGLVGALHRF